MRRLFPSLASSVAAAFVALAALTLPVVAHAGVLGVPVTVSATGTVTGDPPGMFAITGQGLGVGDGDSTAPDAIFHRGHGDNARHTGL